MEDVVQFGTAAARALGRPGGKTGTTNDFPTAWFSASRPQLTAGVWVGYDDTAVSLGKPETGAIAALACWLEFMQSALADKPLRPFKRAAARKVGADKRY